MMDIQKALKVSILGKSYSVMATHEDSADIVKAANLVDNLMKTKVEKANGASEEKIAVTVALQLATDLIKKQQKLDDYENKTLQLASSIDDVL